MEEEKDCIATEFARHPPIALIAVRRINSLSLGDHATPAPISLFYAAARQKGEKRRPISSSLID